MKDVSVSIATSNGTFSLYIYIPAEYRALVGDYVRPEGTLAGGLVLHAAVPPIRGTSFAVQTKPHPGARLQINLPPRFVGAEIAEPKALTPIAAEATAVDGRQVIILDRLDPATMYARVVRHRRTSKPSSTLAPTPATAVDAAPLDRIRAAVAELRRVVRTRSAAEALATLVELARGEGVKIAYNGTELRATIEKDLFR